MNVENFKNLRYNTMLLESLGWDETKLQALFEYLEFVFNNDILDHPSIIEKNIRSHFGDEVANCFTNILKEVMLEYNLNFHGDI